MGTSSITPTPTLVASVQTSLANMADLMRDTHNFSLGTLSTLFQVEETPDVPDESVWITAGQALFLGVVGCIPQVGALVAGVAAAVYVVSQQETAPQPTDFKGALADVSNWLDNSFQAAIEKLDDYAADVEGNWQATFSTPGYQSVQLADLSQTPVPAKGTQEYDVIWNAAMLSVKQALWGQTLSSIFQIMDFGPASLVLGKAFDGGSASDVANQAQAKAGILNGFWRIFGQGTKYYACLSQIAYNRKGDVKTMPESAAAWMFLDDALGKTLPASQTGTAFFTHAQVFGSYDPVTGKSVTPGCIAKHVPLG